MNLSDPFDLTPLFHVGSIPVTEPVVITWGLMVALTLGSWWLTRELKLRPGRVQAALESLVTGIDAQLRDVIPADPAPYRPLIGTIFLYILFANWCALLPGLEPPTARLETDAALALIVVVATVIFGIRTRGLRGWLASFAEPTWAMIPLNIIEQITRSFSLIVRLFGNVMSGVFVTAIILSLAGLIVPIPLMALDLLTGTVQAYIFAMLASVFIAAAVGDGRPSHDPGTAS